MGRPGNCGQRRCRVDDKCSLCEGIVFLTYISGICHVPVWCSAAWSRHQKQGWTWHSKGSCAEPVVRCRGGVQCFLPWAVCPWPCKRNTPSGQQTGGEHVKGAAFLPYGCIESSSIKMQSPPWLCCCSPGLKGLQDHLWGCAVPSLKLPLEWCPGAFEWSCASIKASRHGTAKGWSWNSCLQPTSLALCRCKHLAEHLCVHPAPCRSFLVLSSKGWHAKCVPGDAGRPPAVGEGDCGAWRNPCTHGAGPMPSLSASCH